LGKSLYEFNDIPPLYIYSYAIGGVGYISPELQGFSQAIHVWSESHTLHNSL